MCKTGGGTLSWIYFFNLCQYADPLPQLGFPWSPGSPWQQYSLWTSCKKNNKKQLYVTISRAQNHSVLIYNRSISLGFLRGRRWKRELDAYKKYQTNITLHHSQQWCWGALILHYSQGLHTPLPLPLPHIHTQCDDSDAALGMDSCGKDAPWQDAGTHTHIYTYTPIYTERRKHKSKANKAYLFMDLLSTCSGPQASSIFCAVTVSEYEYEPMKREQTVRKHRAGGGGGEGWRRLRRMEGTKK